MGGIGGEITTQYIVRYTPDVDPDVKAKQFRKITVEIPNLPGVKISAREGYFPNGVPQTEPKEPAPVATKPEPTKPAPAKQAPAKPDAAKAPKLN